jgi:hypothetical protein
MTEKQSVLTRIHGSAESDLAPCVEADREAERGSGGSRPRAVAPAPASGAWIISFFAAVGALFIWRTCIPLKRVRMDDQALYISNFKTEITVPLRDVAEVTENYWLRDRRPAVA